MGSRASAAISRRSSKVSGRGSSPAWSWAVAGEAVEAAQSDAPPKQLGEYRVLRFLGRGGMGSVWLARSAVLDREVALKLLNPSNAPDDLLRFLGEARAIARLHHPNIVRVHELGSDQGRWFIALELVKGGSLAQRIEEVGPLDPREAVNLALRLARALHYAHGRGVLHRDVKPSNVLLAVGGEPLLNDFGLAKDLRSKGPSPTLSGDVLGTPAYMPPEQARAGKLDARCDVYALGATLFEMLTGRAPFLGRGADVLADVLREPPPALRALRPELDPALEALVSACLAKDPAERPASAGALAQELERWLAGRGRVAPPRKVSKPARIRRRLLTIAAASVCALAGGIGMAGLVADEELTASVGLGPMAGAPERGAPPGDSTSALTPNSARRRASRGTTRSGAGSAATGAEQGGEQGPGPRVELVPGRERPEARDARRGRSDETGPGVRGEVAGKGAGSPGGSFGGGSAPGGAAGPGGGAAGPGWSLIRLPEELGSTSTSASTAGVASDGRFEPEGERDDLARQGADGPSSSVGSQDGSAAPERATGEPAPAGQSDGAQAPDASPAGSQPTEQPKPPKPPKSHDEDGEDGEDHEDDDYKQAIAPELDPQGYAWDSYYQPNTSTQGQVTGFAALSPTTLLVEQVPARIDAVEQGGGAPLAQVEATFPARLSSTAAAGEVAVAALSDPAKDGAGQVWERQADGSWAVALEPPRRHTLVASLGDEVYAVSGDAQGGPILIHARDPEGGSWARVAVLGTGIPTRAVAYRGELWIAFRSLVAGTRAQVLRGKGSSWVEVKEPFDGREPGPGERQEVTAFLVVNRFLFAALGHFDATGTPVHGQVVALGKQRLKKVREIRGDAPMALAYQDGTLYVGTRRGRLLLMDKRLETETEYEDGQEKVETEYKLRLDELAGVPVNRGILALHTPDARTLLIGVEGPLGAEVLRRTARSR